jgi:hypothetical protein
LSDQVFCIWYLFHHGSPFSQLGIHLSNGNPAGYRPVIRAAGYPVVRRAIIHSRYHAGSAVDADEIQSGRDPRRQSDIQETRRDELPSELGNDLLISSAHARTRRWLLALGEPAPARTTQFGRYVQRHARRPDLAQPTIHPPALTFHRVQLAIRTLARNGHVGSLEEDERQARPTAQASSPTRRLGANQDGPFFRSSAFSSAIAAGGALSE